MSLLKSLVIVSEKAANIARECRHDRHLFSLLVEEKNEGEANPRFVQDFKTLADVLIQETVKHDVGTEFPELRNHIKGEENNTFRNRLGETINVRILSSVQDTSDLLEKVLNGDSKASGLLAKEVHREIVLEDVNTRRQFPERNDFDIDSLSVWIDPIDSTSEYINGIEKKGESSIFLSGLRCVTVLIGVYDKHTGIPIIGVINQPFHEVKNGKWRGKCYWGINFPGAIPEVVSLQPTNVICLSGSENQVIKNKLGESGYKLVEAAGAGYKVLTVILGLADAYILSKNSTFKWDTCGPQAILNSFGGGLIVFNQAIAGEIIPVDYKDDSFNTTDKKIDKYCNHGGIIAYKNVTALKCILDIFSV